PLYSFSSCSTTGVSRTQLGHHSAQKSTMAAGALRTSAAKFWSFTAGRWDTRPPDSDSDPLLDLVDELFALDGPAQAADFLAGLVEHDGREPEDAQLARGLGGVVDLGAEDLELARVVLRDLLHHGSEHLAPASPLAPEIDQGSRRSEDFALPVLVGRRRKVRHLSSLGIWFYNSLPCPSTR